MENGLMLTAASGRLFYKETEMKWNKYRIKTTEEAEDMISYTLGELGIEGVEIEDKAPLSEEDKKKMFVDILPDLVDDDGTAYVSFYIEPEKDSDELMEKIKKALHELSAYVNTGDLTITRTQTADVDWMNNWKKYWKPFRADDHIIILPTWEEPIDAAEDDLVITLDPGMSFGTGTHHTTKLCIHQLSKYVKPGMHVLDVGTGSGILSIISAKLGADSVCAVDIDPDCITSLKENMKVNDLTEKEIESHQGDLNTDRALRETVGLESYDIVVANILADVIMPLSDVVGEVMKPGALFISSGILESRGDEVKEALLRNHFEIVEMTQSGEWVSFTARKPAV